MRQAAFDDTNEMLDKAEKFCERSQTHLKRAFDIEDTNGHEPVGSKPPRKARPKKRKTLWAKLKSMLG